MDLTNRNTARPIAPPVLVLGASSLIGRSLLPLSGSTGATMVGVGRNMRAGTWVAADLTRPDLVRKLPKAGQVVSAAPIWLLPTALEALAAQGMTRLVAFSSTSRFTKANSEDRGERAVAARLQEAEAAVIAFCEARDIAWTVLRPTLIYAEGQDQNISRLATLIRRIGFLPIAGAGQGRRQPVHAQDLARIALTALTCDAAKNRAYDLPGGETLTYRAMAVRIFEGMGRRPLILNIPLTLWRFGLALAAPVLPGATAAMGARMAEDLTFDAAPAQRDLGWAPRGFRPKF